jgi:hypothetical protein
MTGLVGSPMSKTMSPVAPAGARWMCMTVGSATSCVQTSVSSPAPLSKRAMQPPRSVVGTGAGASWSPERWKTKMSSVGEVWRLRNVQTTVSPASTRMVALRVNGSPVLSGSSHERSARV